MVNPGSRPKELDGIKPDHARSERRIAGGKSAKTERAAYTFRMDTTFGGPNGLNRNSDQSNRLTSKTQLVGYFSARGAPYKGGQSPLLKRRGQYYKIASNFIA